MEIDLSILGLSLILMHEMDAIRCKEWRIFPGLSFLPDKLGMPIFVFAHVPLFYWVLAMLRTNNELFLYRFDIFLIIHLFLHLLFLMHPKNEFKDWISWTCILGAALFGLLDLL